MAERLTGKRVAFLMTDGFEQVEFTRPWEALRAAGAEVELIAPETGTVQGMNHVEPADAFEVDHAASDVEADLYDALVLPGGVVNADHLRMDRPSVAFARGFFEQHKPVAVICHGAWILAEADVLHGRRMTSYPSLRTDLANAGADWVDEQVVVDEGLVSSRRPDDLPAFIDATIEEISEGAHAGQVA
ncbi:type 1 glutamine amidotransferase domain-containing protein [Agromyces aurantiacus]|uniref:Type 1 glutamine amidotransferase domain-containing protein n=1 Tax=Agromyces aurantiacus TaxID=165814 RepID=A0ABV9R7M5_9MICO|nr:type 1 glutamine amidotransferase domain-containing protein [Agromyces aurantiacus]MBM7504417.1 protease I [Agromyces aurantiacus]